MGRAEKRRQSRIDRQNTYDSIPVRERELYSKVANGRITGADLERLEQNAYEKGYMTAGVTAAENTMMICYAAAAKALKEIRPETNQNDVTEFLTCMDRHAAYGTDSMEAVREVLDEFGILLAFDDPVERVQQKAVM